MAGVDFGRQDTSSDRQQGFFDAAGTIQRLFVPIDETDELPPIFFRDSALRRATAADTDATAWGAYVQDQAKIGRYVELIAGLRRDWFKLHYDDRLSATELTRKDALWSPRLGVVLKPTETLSLYGSWSKSLKPWPLSAGWAPPPLGGAAKAMAPTNTETNDCVFSVNPPALSDRSMPLACQKRVSRVTRFS
jgi:outer membrane receptor for monomeric catechols